VTTSGLVVLGDRVRLGTGIYIEPHVELGDDVHVASGAVIVCSVPAGHAVKRRVVTTSVVPRRQREVRELLRSRGRPTLPW
jgi:serine acetyltransferase